MRQKLLTVLVTLLFVVGACLGTAAFAASGDGQTFHEKTGDDSSPALNVGTTLTPAAKAVVQVVSDFPYPYDSTDGSKPADGVSRYGLLTWDGKDGAAPFQQLKVSKAQNKLPKAVYFRENNAGFNREYEIALYNGRVYVKHRGVSEDWRIAPCPKSLRGHIQAISVDADEIMALDDHNWIYTVVGLFDDTDKWVWSTHFGGAFDINPGYQVVTAENHKWSLSNIDPDYDQTYTDPDGRIQYVGGAGCTQVFFLDPEDPTRIFYIDPWLPADRSREIGTPLHSRFKVQSFSSSASLTFVVNQYGDMFTRLYDYDLSGSDELFFDYSWFSQENERTAEDNSWAERLVTAKIRLPSPSWEKQPKIPGTITDRISVESTAPGVENRRLKVEGKKDGHTGYWTKLVGGSTWKFVRTDLPLEGKVLKNSSKDTSTKDLAPLSGVNYSGVVKGKTSVGSYKATLKVTDFAYNDHEQTASVTVGDVTVPMTLYNEYGNLGTATTMNVMKKQAGLTEELRYYTAAFVLSESAAKKLSGTKEGKAFLKGFMGGELLRTASLQANVNGLYFADDKQLTSVLRPGAFDLLRE